MCALAFPRRGFFMPRKKSCEKIWKFVSFVCIFVEHKHKTHFMKTMYCFRVEFENGVATPVSDIFCMTQSDYLADPASDFDFTQPIPTEPTLWGYETYTIAEEVRRNQEMATYIHNLEISREDARQKRRAIMARKFLNA